MGFKIEKILLTKLDAEGNIPANPTLLNICFEEFTLKDVKKFEEFGCLTKDGKLTTEVGNDIEGGAKIRLDAQTMAVILTHTLGQVTSTTDATTNDWSASTEYAKGDIVNHSDGKHTLVCVNVYDDKKTGGDEPAVTSKSVRDGNVKWAVSKKLLLQTYKMQDSCPLFAVEYQLTDGVDKFYKRFSGAEMSTLPLNISGESSTYEVDFDFKCASVTDNQKADWGTNLAAMAGAKIVSLGRDFFGGSCELSKAYINNVLVTDTESISMTIDKQIETGELT